MGKGGGRWGGERRALLLEKCRSGLLDSDAPTLTDAKHTHQHLDTNRGLGGRAEAGCRQSSQAQGGDFFFFILFFFFFFGSFHPPFSFMDSLLFCRA